MVVWLSLEETWDLICGEQAGLGFQGSGCRNHNSNCREAWLLGS